MFKYIVRSLIKKLTRLVSESSEFTDVSVEVTKLVDKVKLEPKNFRVSSEWWKKKTIGATSVNFKNTLDVLCSPCGGIIEFLYDERFPNLYKEQLFRWDAAMEAVKKTDRRIPTEEQFFALTKKDLWDINYVWYVDLQCQYFWYQKIRSYFWTSTIAYYNDSDTTVHNYWFQCDDHKSFSNCYNKNLYCSIRCIDPTSAYDS